MKANGKKCYLCGLKCVFTMFMKLRILLACALFLTLCRGSLSAQTTASSTTPPTTLQGWADRLERFGKGIPQEKVYVHLDNTCYFLGDTIWFAAYTHRTDKDIPSNLSRVLYVELLNQDGYLMERQLVEMKNGRGHGNFALADTLYAGYYELRAYTRWQLNWGVTEKEHTAEAEEWFFSRELAHDYYRDYDKLYSRVFPVYDKPKEPGEFFHDMTTRHLRRYFKSGAPEPQLMLSLFPEGGHLVTGAPCRVAFEAATEAGEACEGQLDNGAATVNRGRGVFTITPEAGRETTVTFTAKDGRTATAKLPPAETDGVMLKVELQDEVWNVSTQAAGTAANTPLGVTVMHEGVLERFETMNEASSSFTISRSSLPSGVHQVTVFDVNGRVWADRLFFVTNPEQMQPTLTVNSLKKQYEPFEEVKLELKIRGEKLEQPKAAVSEENANRREAALTSHPSSLISLSIRDAATQDYTYDCGNILTEMLLSSEVKGFVPDPSYFFEADDKAHHTALDLLMMTQGWRRFDWHTMATPGTFQLTQPAETQTQILKGEVFHYQSKFLQDDVRRFEPETPTPYQLEEAVYRDTLSDPSEIASAEDNYNAIGQGEVFETIVAEIYAHEVHFPAGSYRMRAPIAVSRFNAKERSLNKEVRVHAEFSQPGSESVVGDAETHDGKFNIPSPHFEGYCVFFLAASDTTKWKPAKPHQWIDVDDTHEPEFYVRIAWPYPRFTQPYSHYQMAYRPVPEQVQKSSTFDPKAFETQMQALTVRASHGGLRKFDLSKPAFVQDAYVAFNDATDAGLMVGRFEGRIHYLNSLARLYVGDMTTSNAYLLEPRYDGSNISRQRPAQQIDKFNQLTNLDCVRLYTDFAPRNGADPRATEDNVGRVGIDLQRYGDESQRVTYRDRRYVLQGFNVADDFYHPDYRRTPPAEGQKDYRRTLYWNPDLQLDAEGRAAVTFFNGSRPATLTVEANGQADDGTLLTNFEH